MEIPGVKTFSDSEGNPIPMKIRPIGMDEVTKIRTGCTRRRIAKDNKGKMIFNNGSVVYDEQQDSTAMSNHMIAASLVFPDLHDKDLLLFYGVESAADAVTKVFSRPDDYRYIIGKIQEISGLTDDGDEVVEEAKN